jgi:AmmeMemoRadiSam system protein A
MIDIPLSPEERNTLLRLARRSIELAIIGRSLPRLVLSDFSAPMREQGASFVTLTERGELRGCIGTLEAYQPLVQDVCEHAVAAATEDTRFSPVQPFEFPRLKIEISRLTPPTPLQYTSPEELLTLLHPLEDGVVLKDMGRRATTRGHSSTTCVKRWVRRLTCGAPSRSMCLPTRWRSLRRNRDLVYPGKDRI